MGNQTLGRGKLYFSLLKNDGITPIGYRYLGNTPAITLTIQNDTLDHFSSDEGIKEKDNSVVIQTNATGSLTTDEISVENMALYFFGEHAVIAQTSATAATYTITDAEPGMTYQIGRTEALPTGVRQLSNVVVEVGVTTHTLGDDYTLDAELGLITILEDGDIASGADVEITFDRAARSRSQVISGSTQVEGSLLYVSTNPEGDKIDYLMPWVKLSPNGDFALKSGDQWQEMQLSIEILKATGYERIYADGRPYTP